MKNKSLKEKVKYNMKKEKALSKVYGYISTVFFFIIFINEFMKLYMEPLNGYRITSFDIILILIFVVSLILFIKEYSSYYFDEEFLNNI